VHLFWGPSGNLIGGTTVGAGNVISGNGGHGVMMEGFLFPRGGDASTIGNRVEGNFIGTNADGIDLGNDGDGVALLEFTRDNVIGGSTAGARNVISGNAGDGVRLSGIGNSMNRVEGNFIGTNAAGSAAVPNEDGVTIEEGAGSAVIGATTPGARNIISGNADDGIALAFTAGNTVQGNFIGTNADGTGPLGNLGAGISLSDSANSNLIGGTAAGARNVISANGDGIVIEGSAFNRVQGNRIGTDRTGTADLGNTQNGVVLEEAATRNVIGGAVAGARNIISGNDANGVLIQGIDAALNRVRGNFIGTDRTGTLDLGNTLFGVALRGGAHDNAIGGDLAGTGNVISGNDSSGVLLEELDTEDNLVQGNWIGTDATRTLDLGNALHGVFITDNASRNSIGGTTTGAGNVIAFNGEDGVLVGSDPGQGFNNPAGTRNAINQNRIYSNGGLGIDLGPNDGVTPNDNLDPDTGPNRLQNFPEMFSVQLLPAGLNIEGFIRTEPNRTYRIEFFVSPAGDDEGKRYLGFVTVNTDPEGNASYNATFSAAGVVLGQVVTATATHEFGDTSEFSPAINVT
jgi:titin